MSKELSLEALQHEAITFRRECDAVMLATVSPEGVPDASIAPCIIDSDGCCYVLISQLARHTGNLLARPVASLLWVEDTAVNRNAFARRRLVLQCTAETIERDSDAWHRILGQMGEQLGNTVDLLAGLPDFMLFRFSGVEGSYIRGFAQAYPVSGNTLVMSARRSR